MTEMFPGDVMDHHVSLFQQGFLGSYFDNTFTNTIDQTTSESFQSGSKEIWLSVIGRQMGQMDLAERDWPPNGPNGFG